MHFCGCYSWMCVNCRFSRLCSKLEHWAFNGTIFCSGTGPGPAVPHEPPLARNYSSKFPPSCQRVFKKHACIVSDVRAAAFKWDSRRSEISHHLKTVFVLKFSKVISITHFSFAGRVNTDERGRRASAFEMTPWVFWVLRKAASILKNKNCTEKIFFKGKKKMLTRSEITSRRTSLPISRSSSSLCARCEWERTESDPPPQKNTFVMPNKKNKSVRKFSV